MSNPSSGSNPLLQPPFYVIPGIDPSSPISAQTEQIDQLNTLLLQEIDANFARFHQIVTSRILPEIKRFAIAGEPTREAAQFWRSFFEAASSIRLPGTNDVTLPSQHDTSTQYDDQTMTLRRDHDDTEIAHGHGHGNQEDDSGSFIFDPPATSSTPLPSGKHQGGAGGRINESWEDSMESPFDRLDRKLRDDLKIGKNGEYDGIANHSNSSSDLPTPSLPSGYSLPNLSKNISSATGLDWNNEQNQNQNQQHDYENDYSTGTIESNQLYSHSLQQRQQQQQQSRPNSATPKANRTKNTSASASNYNPFGPNFSGIADLRSTPLNPKTKSSRTKKPPKTSILPDLDIDSSDEEDGQGGLPFGMSPPVTMKFSLPPKAQAVLNVAKANTPRKPTQSQHHHQQPRQSIYDELLEDQSDAVTADDHGQGEKQAKHILDDLLEEMGSELSPRLDTPEGLGRYSILPNELQPGEARLLFSGNNRGGTQHQEQIYQPSSSHPANNDHDNRNRRSLANTSFGSDVVDLPVGQQIYTDDSFNEEDDTFDTDDGISTSIQSHTGTGTHPPTGTGTMSSVPYSTHEFNVVGADDSYLSSEGDITSTSEAGVIFGGGSKQPSHYQSQFQQPQHQQSSGTGPGAGGRKSNFNLMTREEMDTYHGGRLEDAAGEDVVHSPLYVAKKSKDYGQ
ncbi:uncharacterized protein IL334_005870 [Kwoniella shivajii]|uniref:DASH complex subunit ASK1 n=1 Tax=Kwoniella shivajii TaxID=564305 RepID=A0ABZ1D4B6_9TREE|nr:hypothetical protein IL334_005870 [Kwoniella shivajii]